MTFNNISFYGFLLAVVWLHYLLPKRWRWVWLLLSSLIFYAFTDVRFLFVLLACTAVSYFCALVLERNIEDNQRKFFAVLGVGLVLGVLVLFKYLDFLLLSINALFPSAGLHWNLRGLKLLIPLGISFYTLQAVSYLLDVYHHKIIVERNFARFALYMVFFPKLLSGPIERYESLRAQLYEPQPFDFERCRHALLRIGWGLFKKIVIADRLAVAADAVFSAPQEFAAPQLVFGVLAFAFQVYLDFSAYTDIALGAASLLGVQLSENFKRPYFATSVIDFWRRWHITLSSWLRDYVFLPLNYQHRRRQPRSLWTALDVMLTFLVSGLWHGQQWTFIAWGALHGFYQAVEILTQKSRDAWLRKLKLDRQSPVLQAFQILVTFTLVCFSWIFFKADSMGSALHIIRSIFNFKDYASLSAWSFTDGSLGLDAADTVLMGAVLLFFMLVEYLQEKMDLLEKLKAQPRALRWALYYALFFAITIFGYYGESSAVDFVYFQF